MELSFSSWKFGVRLCSSKIMGFLFLSFCMAFDCSQKVSSLEVYRKTDASYKTYLEHNAKQCHLIWQVDTFLWMRQIQWIYFWIWGSRNQFCRLLFHFHPQLVVCIDLFLFRNWVRVRVRVFMGYFCRYSFLIGVTFSDHSHKIIIKNYVHF